MKTILYYPMAKIYSEYLITTLHQREILPSNETIHNRSLSLHNITEAEGNSQ